MPPSNLADVLAALRREPGRPRLTWYGDAGERIELSGAVLGNWVSKTANLLVEEFDARPGTRVLIDLPPHWRTVVWAFAVWRVGACVVLPSDDEAPASDVVDVVVTGRPERFGRVAPVVAVALPALARTFGSAMPAGAIDAASAVMTYGDTIGWAPPVDPTAPALVGAGATEVRAHARLMGWAGGTADPGARTLVPTSVAPSVAQGTARALRDVLCSLRSAGSVVLVDPATSEAIGLDTSRRDRLVATERITATATGG